MDPTLCCKAPQWEVNRSGASGGGVRRGGERRTPGSPGLSGRSRCKDRSAPPRAGPPPGPRHKMPFAACGAESASGGAGPRRREWPGPPSPPPGRGDSGDTQEPGTRYGLARPVSEERGGGAACVGSRGDCPVRHGVSPSPIAALAAAVLWLYEWEQLCCGIGALATGFGFESGRSY